MNRLNRLANGILARNELAAALLGTAPTCCLCHGAILPGTGDDLSHRSCSFRELLALDMIDGPDWDDYAANVSETWPSDEQVEADAVAVDF